VIRRKKAHQSAGISLAIIPSLVVLAVLKALYGQSVRVLE
jgi:hypothetical protein